MAPYPALRGRIVWLVSATSISLSQPAAWYLVRVESAMFEKYIALFVPFRTDLAGDARIGPDSWCWVSIRRLPSANPITVSYIPNP